MNDRVAVTAEFLTILERSSQGRKDLATALRSAVAAVANRELDAVPLDDEAYLEPRLFAWSAGCGRSSIGIDQLFARDLIAQGGNVEAHFGRDGTAFLSGVGHLVRDDHASDSSACGQRTLFGGDFVDGLPRGLSLEESPRIGRTTVRWVVRADPVLDEFVNRFVDGSGGFQLVEPRPFTSVAESAIDLLEAVAPELCRLLCRSVREVLIFKHAGAVNSFASLAMHGVICLRQQVQMTMPYFLENIVHQGTHATLFESTLDRTVFFSVDPESRLGSISGTSDRRTVYEWLHGLFTEFAVLNVMEKARVNSRPTPREQVEISARMALAFDRLSRDVGFGVAGEVPFVSEQGEHYLHFLEEELKRLASLRCQLAFDIDGHGEDFDSATFWSRNPSITSDINA